MGNKNCSDCAWMDTNSRNDGRFACTNRKSAYKVVSARQSASICPYFCDCFYSKRGQRERDNFERISRSHGYYIMTALCTILGSTKQMMRYYNCFAYLRDNNLPLMDDGADFLLDYEENGPYYAECLKSDEHAYDYCTYLCQTYLPCFEMYMNDGEVEEALRVYNMMYQEIKKRYPRVNKTLNLNNA